jgi:hypothetical protein
MGSDATTISPSTLLSFSIGNVRTPPSVAAMTGITIATASVDGYMIDQNAKQVSYQVSIPALIPSSYVTVTALSAKLNASTTLTIRI